MWLTMKITCRRHKMHLFSGLTPVFLVNFGDLPGLETLRQYSLTQHFLNFDVHMHPLGILLNTDSESVGLSGA